MRPSMSARGSPETFVRILMDRGIHDKRVLDAFSRIHRADFVPEEFVAEAYIDEPISIGQAQVTQPSLIAMMVHALRLIGTEKVLEIGTGFGRSGELSLRKKSSQAPVAFRFWEPFFSTLSGVR